MNIEEPRKLLVGFMEQTGTKQAKVAKEMGLSATTISQFLNGTYAGNNADIANDVGTVLFGKDASECGLINEVGGLSDAIDKLYSLIEKDKKDTDMH